MAWNDTFSAFRPSSIITAQKLSFQNFDQLFNKLIAAQLAIWEQSSQRDSCALYLGEHLPQLISDPVAHSGGYMILKKSDTKKAHLVVLAQIFDL
jgi:hypothetical protein